VQFNIIKFSFASSRQNETGPVIDGARWFFTVLCFGLAWYDVGRTGAFLTLSDHELDLLALGETGVAVRLDFRVMNEQVLTAGVGADEPKTFLLVKPFYCTCTHYCTPLACNGRK